MYYQQNSQVGVKEPSTSSVCADVAPSGTACGHRNGCKGSESAPALLLMVGLYSDHLESLSHKSRSKKGSRHDPARGLNFLELAGKMLTNTFRTDAMYPAFACASRTCVVCLSFRGFEYTTLMLQFVAAFIS
jgi:hypothetical protein